MPEESTFQMLDNVKIDSKKMNAHITVNPKIHPPSTIYSSCYTLFDKNYVFITESDDKFKIEITPKKDTSIKDFGLTCGNFNNLLITQTSNLFFISKNKKLNNIILKGVEKAHI
ncbi:MAG: hypothetical protein J7K00_05725 [Candidatus Diapherotrites archaeon]|nr:hypothetical protein [Candidatus Diapherotrites archaeon]